MDSKEISRLDPYSGPNNPVGHIPITILGVTYKITPQQMFILSDAILAALQGAASPSGSNVFATLADIPGATLLPWGTFRIIGKGQGNTGPAAEVGDLFEGGLASGEWCPLAVWQGGALDDEANFLVGPTFSVPTP